MLPGQDAQQLLVDRKTRVGREPGNNHRGWAARPAGRRPRSAAPRRAPGPRRIDEKVRPEPRRVDRAGPQLASEPACAYRGWGPAGRAPPRPHCWGDKAYSARAHREHLRARGVTAVIPERTDQVANRKRRGSAGGRPVSYDRNASRGRNVIERAFNRFKNWRAIATRLRQARHHLQRRSAHRRSTALAMHLGNTPNCSTRAQLPSGSHRAREAWRRLLAAANELHKRAVGS